MVGAALFLLFDLMSADTDSSANQPQPVITVTATQQARLAAEFQRTWLRPPSGEEQARLIENHVREEVLYREALRLGLDQGDAIVRRRLTQKMEFLAASGAELLEPADSDLDAYLAANADAFREPGQVAFRQIYLGEAPTAAEIEAARAALASSGPADVPDSIGRRTMLPATSPPATPRQVDGQFGSGFAAALMALPSGAWQGPVQSGFGVHFVYVEQQIQGGVPALDSIRDQVARDWRSAKADELRALQYQQIRAGYRIEMPDAVSQ